MLNIRLWIEQYNYDYYTPNTCCLASRNSRADKYAHINILLFSIQANLLYFWSS